MVTTLALLTTILLWSSAFVGIRATLPCLGPIDLAVVRFSIAGVTLLAFVPLMKPIPVSRADWPRFLVAGAVGIAGYNLLLNFGQRDIDAASASLLVNTVPFLTALGAWLAFSERPGRTTLLGMVICFAGAFVTALARGANPSWAVGSALVLGAACCQAVYFLAVKPLLRRYGPLQVTFIAIVVGTLLMLPFGATAPAKLAHAPRAVIAAAIYLGVGPAALAYFTWSIALGRLPAGYASSFLFLVPVTTPIIAWIWLRETPPPMTLLGGALVVSGLIVANGEALGLWARNVMAPRGPAT